MVQNKQWVRNFFLKDDISWITKDYKQTITRLKIKSSLTPWQVWTRNCTQAILGFGPPGNQIMGPANARHMKIYINCGCPLHSWNYIKFKHWGNVRFNYVQPEIQSLCLWCQECFLRVPATSKIPSNADIVFKQWLRRNRSQDDDKRFAITVKREMTSTEIELNCQFHDCLFKFWKHIFYIRWQYGVYPQLKQNLASNQWLIHVDCWELQLQIKSGDTVGVFWRVLPTAYSPHWCTLYNQQKGTDDLQLHLLIQAPRPSSHLRTLGSLGKDGERIVFTCGTA